MLLEQELATYEAMRAELAQHEGTYALISGDQLLGIFDSQGDALDAGYKAKGLDPFLVKRISRIESVLYFSRDIRPSECIFPAQ